MKGYAPIRAARPEQSLGVGLPHPAWPRAPATRRDRPPAAANHPCYRLRMSTMSRLLMSACLAGAVAVPASAQGEAELKDFFEGKSVRVKIDMPATQEGIDVYPDARRAIDFTQYSAR